MIFYISYFRAQNYVRDLLKSLENYIAVNYMDLSVEPPLKFVFMACVALKVCIHGVCRLQSLYSWRVSP